MGTLDKVKGLVENPPKEYRSAPFWGWNDRLQKENLGEQIEGFKKAGMGGFFIHSREGLETEYLSTEWMEDVKFCVDKARENDPFVGLRDNFHAGSASCKMMQLDG